LSQPAATPPPSPDSAILNQILLKLGEMGTQLAVMGEQLKELPDHEQRIRSLERFRWTFAGISVVGSLVSGFAGYLVGHVSFH